MEYVEYLEYFGISKDVEYWNGALLGRKEQEDAGAEVVECRGLPTGISRGGLFVVSEPAGAGCGPTPTGIWC